MINCVLGDHNANNYVNLQYVKLKQWILNKFPIFCNTCDSGGWVNEMEIYMNSE